MGTSLTTAERTRLGELEEVVEHGMGTFVEVGAALLEIRDSRLYRQTHARFEDYCRDRWGMSRIHAHRLIEASETVSAVLPIGNIAPANEAQARPLARLEPEQQRAVWAEVVETAPRDESDKPVITAAHVESVVQSRREPPRTNSDAITHHFHRRVSHKITDFLTAAYAFATVDDEEIRELEVNDIMLENLRRAAAQLNRIITLHSDAGARHANG